MPMVRCKHYRGNGHPVGGGCTSLTCPYVHPDNRELWNSLPIYKTLIRCKHYDNDGSHLSDCLDGRQCRFVHPDDRSWAWAQPTKHLPLPKPSRTHAVSERLSSDTYTSKRSHTTLHPGVPKKKKTAGPSSSKALGGNVKEKNTPLLTSLEPRRMRLVSGTTSAGSSAPVDVPSTSSLKSPSVCSSALPQTAGGLKHQALRDLILSLAQAANLRQELRNVKTRISLRSVETASTSSTLNNGGSDHLLSDTKEVEEKFDAVVTRLTNIGFWPVPSFTEVMAQLDRRTHSIAASLGELTGRLDRVEARLVERVEARALLSKDITASTSSAEMGESAPRFLKHRRLSVDDSLTQKSDVVHVMDRLDCMEQKLFDVEEGGVWHDDRIAEKITKLIEERIENHQISFPVRMDDGSGLSRGNRALEPLEKHLRSLERNFTAFCGEVADHLPTAGKLQAQLRQLHLDQADAKKTMASLESSCEQLQGQLESVSGRMHVLSSELISRRSVSDSQPSATESRDYIIRAVRQDVKDHISSVQDDLATLITSHFKDAQSAVIMNFEPTIMKTNKIYNMMSRNPQGAIAGAPFS